MKKKDEMLMSKTEMRMVRWIQCVSLRDHIRNEEIRKAATVHQITKHLMQKRLRLVWTCETQRSSSSFVSFTQFFSTCGRMPLPARSLWPGRQQCSPRLVGGRRGGGPSSVAPRSRNPPTGRSRDGHLLITIFARPTSVPSPLQIQPAKTRPPLVPF